MALTTINRPDSQKALFGTGDDIEIYHDGTDSYITNIPDTGDLRIRGDSIKLQDNDHGHNYLDAAQDGAVRLYYDNVVHLETTSWGAQVTGAFVSTGYIDLSDGDGSSTGSGLFVGTGDDLKIYHDGTNSRIYNSTGNLSFRSGSYYFNNAAGTENCLDIVADGAVSMYYNAVKKFETVSDGVAVSGHVKLLDDSKVIIGTGLDLQLYHDGSHSYIDDAGTGSLYISTSGLIVREAGTNDNILVASGGSSVDLYHDNSKKLETTSAGVTVTGALTATGLVDATCFTATDGTGYSYIERTDSDANIAHNSYTTIAANYGWALPGAGTYLLVSSMRVRLWGVTGLIQCRLYDTTNSSAVGASTRMMFEQADDASLINTQVTLHWVHTCTGAVTINQQFSTNDNSTNSSIQNDSNGRNYVYWQRIG